GRERKLRNIRNPLLVGRISGEVAVDDVGHRGAEFTSVGCVFAPLAAHCDETVFSHEAANDLFRNGDAVSPENGMNSPVSVAAFGLSEHNANPFTDGGKLVWGCHRRLLIKVAALGQAQASQQVPKSVLAKQSTRSVVKNPSICKGETPRSIVYAPQEVAGHARSAKTEGQHVSDGDHRGACAQRPFPATAG